MVRHRVQVHVPEDLTHTSKEALGKLRAIVCQQPFRRPILGDHMLYEGYGYIVCRYKSHRNDLSEINETIRYEKYEEVSSLSFRKRSQEVGSD